MAMTNRGGCRSFEAIANAGKKEISVPLLRVLERGPVLCADGWPPYRVEISGDLREVVRCKR